MGNAERFLGRAMSLTGSAGGTFRLLKWCLVIASIGIGLVVCFRLAPAHRQAPHKPAVVHRANPPKAPAVKPGQSPNQEQSLQRSSAEQPPVPPKLASTPQIESSTRGSVPDSLLDEDERWVPEVYVEEEGEVWMGAGMELADDGTWIPEDGKAWRPVVILPPGVTAEFENSPDDGPATFDNLTHRRVTRSTLRSGGSRVRGQR